MGYTLRWRHGFHLTLAQWVTQYAGAMDFAIHWHAVLHIAMDHTGRRHHGLHVCWGEGFAGARNAPFGWWGVASICGDPSSF